MAVAIIVLAQCLSTSLWFSPSGVADSLKQQGHWKDGKGPKP